MFVITSTVAMGGLAGYSFLKNSIQSNDADKINRIFINSGLYVKENKEQKNIRIHKKRKIEGGMEYIFQLPLGLSFKKVQEFKHVIEDGLNVKNTVFLNFEDLKKINWKKNPIPQIKKLINKKEKVRKEVDLDFDGMLKIKVYEQGLGDKYLLTKDIMEQFTGTWKVALGKTLNSEIVHDFEDGPMVLIGGATDMGKSNILNLIFTTLVNNQPETVKFTLIDLKGGLEFGPYENLKQVKGFADDVASAKNALESVQVEMETNFNMLRRTGKRNVQQAGIKERHFIIIDEAAELSSTGETDSEMKKLKVECEGIIKDIARRGRASGMRMIYCTQYPTTETVSSQVKRNLITRIALPCDTSTASKVVLDEGGAEDLPLIKGRSIYKRHKCTTMQAYYIDDDLINKTIEPHINIRSRSEKNESLPPHEKTADGGYIIES